jgi:mitochondrial ATPase complex subunit ATP10
MPKVKLLARSMTKVWAVATSFHSRAPLSRPFAARQIMKLTGRSSRLICMACQWRSFSTAYRRLAEQTPKAATTSPAAVAEKPKRVAVESPLADAPRAYGKRVEKFTPKPLPRPIGLPFPPEAGENTGIDYRSMQQRRDDFVNMTKHLERRETL